MKKYLKRYIMGMLLTGLVFVSGTVPAHAASLFEMQTSVASILAQVNLLPSTTIAELQLKVGLLQGALSLQTQVNAMIQQNYGQNQSSQYVPPVIVTPPTSTSGASYIPPSITITAPVGIPGGLDIISGSTYTIRWTSTNVARVKPIFVITAMRTALALVVFLITALMHALATSTGM